MDEFLQDSLSLESRGMCSSDGRGLRMMMVMMTIVIMVVMMMMMSLVSFQEAISTFKQWSHFPCVLERSNYW